MSLEHSSAIDLGDLIDLDLAHPEVPREPFKQALEIRKAILGPEDPFIAYSLNNLALAYTEMGELDFALKSCDSQYDVASILLKQGHVSSAIQMLEEIVGISKTFTEGQGQQARALFNIAEVYKERELEDAPFEEAEFSKLCLWMLW
ncbi:hypothetical protein V2G26_002192 [Clonostachys chloroleuca]